MSMRDIRSQYGVPARRGQRVRITEPDGRRREGAVIGSQYGQLSIRLDGMVTTCLVHPTHPEYLGPDGQPMQWWVWVRESRHGSMVNRSVRILLADADTRALLGGAWHGPFADDDGARKSGARYFWADIDPGRAVS